MRGPKMLIKEASLQLHPGHKVGLTGVNGAGKSSLFSLLRGEIHAESGDLEVPGSWVTAHVAQETPALEISALEFVLDGDAELRHIETSLAEAEKHHQGAQIAELHHRLLDIDGYSARARAAELLNGLGFSQAALQQAVATFSGGWRVRLNLARALMCRSDLLLLDEPTNHLDLDAVIWLEGWLQSYRGTLFLISHDRDFLDAIVNHIAHIEQQTLTLYRGGYSDFERQRAEKLALQQAMFEKQQHRVAHLQSYIDRFRVQATKARQAQSRIKALERMEMISAAHVDSQFSFEFKAPTALPDPLLVFDKIAVGYHQVPFIRDITLTIRPGARVGLLGHNGAGKTTLIKSLAQELQAMNGKRVEGKELRIGYFAQHQLEQLQLEDSPLQHMLRLDPLTREQEHLDYLGGFNFKGEMAKTACINFSGGEKSRLALALLIWTRPNLLLLDEPTNHLDLEMRHALTFALQDFKGGVVLVSHDRALLRATCDQFFLVAEGRVQLFDGDLEDYSHWLSEQRSREKVVTTDKVKNNDRASNKLERQARINQRRPWLKELEQLECAMAQYQEDKRYCDERLGDSALYTAQNKTELQELLKRHAGLVEKIDGAEERWLTLHALLEDTPVSN